MPSSSPAQLLEEIRSLRQTVTVLQSAIEQHCRVALRPTQPHAFLGQPITITAKVVDGKGVTPKANVPVTFIATWGKLRKADHVTTPQGNSLTIRTDEAGTARVTLLPPTSDNLWEVQQDALETMLGLLDSRAVTPQETESGLVEMVRQYRWQPNVQFRQAVDTYIQDFHPSLFSTVNFQDSMRAWSFVESMITAYVQAEETEEQTPTSVQTMANLTFRFKDWIPSWLQAHLSFSSSEHALGNDLQDLKSQDNEPTSFLDGVHGRIRDFSMGQHGLAGSYIGQKVTQTVLHDFLNSGIDDLTSDVKVKLFPSVDTVSKTLATSGIAGLTALTQTQANFQQDVQDAVGREANGAMLGFKDDLATERGTAFEGFKGDVAGERTAVFTGFQTALGTERTGALNAFKGQMTAERGTAFKGFKSDVAGERTAVFTGFQTALGTERTGALNAFKGQVTAERGTAFKGFKSDVAGERTAVFTGFRTALGTEQTGALSSFRGSLATERTNSLSAFKGTLTSERTKSLNTFKGTLTSERTKSLNTFRGSITTERTKSLNVFKGTLTTERTKSFNTFKGTLTNERTKSLNTFKGTLTSERTKSLNTFKRSLTSERSKSINTFSTQLTTSRTTQLQTFNTQLTTSRTTQFQTFKTALTAAAPARTPITFTPVLRR